MDILISSNLERLLYTVVGCEKTKDYMTKLSSDGKYALDSADFSKISENFVGYYTDETECESTVRDTYNNIGSLIDTHTAIAVSAAKRYIEDTKASRKMLVVSTASPYKFAADVYASLGGARPDDDLLAPDMLEEKTGVAMPRPLAALKGKVAIHTGVIEKDYMMESVMDFVRK